MEVWLRKQKVELGKSELQCSWAVAPEKNQLLVGWIAMLLWLNSAPQPYVWNFSARLRLYLAKPFMLRLTSSSSREVYRLWLTDSYLGLHEGKILRIGSVPWRRGRNFEDDCHNPLKNRLIWGHQLKSQKRILDRVYKLMGTVHWQFPDILCFQKVDRARLDSCLVWFLIFHWRSDWLVPKLQRSPQIQKVQGSLFEILCHLHGVNRTQGST